MKRSNPLALLGAPFVALSRWRERARAEVEREEAFEAWLANSGLDPNFNLSRELERDNKERPSA